MKKLLSLTALALVSFSANAAIYTINSGNWASTTIYNNNAAGTPNTTGIYDGGDATPLVQLGGVPNPAFDWKEDAAAPPYPVKALPAAFTGTYSGTIETNGSGDVIGGSLVITGTVGDQVIVGTNSWWLRIWEDVTIDLATGVGTVGSVDCARSDFAPANCTPGVTAGMPFAWNISDGSVTPGGCYLPGASNDPINDPGSTAAPCGPNGPARLKATFDGTTLSLLVEGRDAAGDVDGTDTVNEFTLSTTVVPVPAAVWLFGSALGLLGWGRRKA